jgi:hypothetical protein
MQEFVPECTHVYNGDMSKRFLPMLIISCMFAFMPLAASADDAPVEDPAPAAGLGPAGSGPAGGAKTDFTLLQPAGGSPLQSTTGDSTGLTAPSANTLQMPASNEETLRVLNGEADGSPAQVAPTGMGLSWIWFSLLFGAVVALAAWLTRHANWAQPFHRRLRDFFITPTRE